MLNKLSDIGVLVLVAIAAVMLYTRPQGPKPPAPPFKVGQTLKASFTVKEPTLVVVASSKCPYCNKSLATFQGLIADAQAKGRKTVFVSSDNEAEGMAWLGAPATYVEQKSAAFNINGVPTLFVLGPNNTIRFFRQGMLNTDNKDNKDAAKAVAEIKQALN